MENRRESKKIFILASTLVVGGAEMIIRSIAETLPDEGFQVELLFLREPGKVGDLLIGKGFDFRSGISRSRFDPLALYMLLSLFRRHRNSVLLSLDHHNAVFLGALASRWAGIKGSVLSVHSTGLWGSGRTFTFTDRAVLKLYDRIVALSDTHARYLVEDEEVPGDSVEVINNGIDVERFNRSFREKRGGGIREELGLENDHTVVTIVAALRPEKNHLMFLEAAGRVAGESERARFLIVGDGEMREALESEAGRRKLSDRVFFLGNRDDIPEILAATDISVLSSHPVVETFPLTVLEAMACGLPVISTDVGSVSEIISHRDNG
ncbi:MAG: glycosyltransferase, partial [Candidatus Latescibacteria bacterium]|nr:glycosyltransferase [bacterium]MBD3424713.1 glycosyltransferase [Candidatus Latescibacterota bacterium]